MWVCNTHIKEALKLLETPHISKTQYQIKCSLCDSRAIAKVFYAHQTIKFANSKKKYSSPWKLRKELV